MDSFIPPDRWEFIWASYAVFFVTLAVLVIWPIVRKKQLKKELKQYYQRKKLLQNEQE
ncbi:MAG: heme exporter protein CcmD [Gammaproteobacteria bacterium]|nr:heme exporter protein CcmD [Gammaproteobacteria bacterium]